MVGILLKGLAILIVFFVLLLTLKQYILIPIGILILLYIIRLLADVFWWGKDRGKW